LCGKQQEVDALKKECLGGCQWEAFGQWVEAVRRDREIAKSFMEKWMRWKRERRIEDKILKYE
jgi:hypothetical protein